MDRDAVLAAALGAAVLTGCTGRARRSAPTPSAPPPSASPTPTDPDVATLLSWAAAERSIAARYAAFARSVPSLAALRTNHLARAEAVEEQLAFRGVRVVDAPATPPLRGARRSVVRAFATAERRLAADYLRDLRALRDAGLAVLGAELATGARQHAIVLDRVPVA